MTLSARLAASLLAWAGIGLLIWVGWAITP